MKIFFVLVMITHFASASQTVVKELPKEIGDKGRQFLEQKEDEDCEEKAKKPVIIPEEPSLGGLGTAGCSLEDM